MHGLIETLGGLWELAALGCRSRFRLGGAFWRWRNETAFGNDPSCTPSRLQRWRRVLAYGRWVYRMMLLSLPTVCSNTLLRLWIRRLRRQAERSI